MFYWFRKRDYKTATTSQKCVRAGGKHNDLAWTTPRHHTFFEMLEIFPLEITLKAGNYSCLEFINKRFSIAKEKLSVTVYHKDEESFKLWKKIAGLSDDKIIKIATSDNFWSMEKLVHVALLRNFLRSW